MEYKVLDSYGRSADEAIRSIEHAVKLHIILGWELQGGIQIIQNASSYNFIAIQAMVKREE